MNTRARNLVVIENSVIDAMLADPTARAQFANCLSPVANAPVTAGCSKCKKHGSKDASVYNQAKLCFAQAADSRQQQLKDLLQARQIQITASLNGEVKTFSF